MFFCMTEERAFLALSMQMEGQITRAQNKGPCLNSEVGSECVNTQLPGTEVDYAENTPLLPRSFVQSAMIQSFQKLK